MAINPEDLTIDFSFRNMLAVPKETREQLANSGVLDQFMNQMSPTQMALLFPDYYKQGLSDVVFGGPGTSGFVSQRLGLQGAEQPTYESDVERRPQGGQPGRQRGRDAGGVKDRTKPATARPPTLEERQVKLLRDRGLLAAPAGSSGVGYRGKQVSQQDNDMVVKILLAEAVAGSDEDIRNIAWVIRNRVSRSKMSPYEVVTSPAQFSAYGDGTYRRKRSAEDIERATKIWNEVLNAPPSSDPTGGADHYYNPRIANPSWAKNLAEGSRGQLSKESPHVFFNAAALGKGFRNSGGKSEYFAQTDETYQEDVAKTTEQPETVELNTARVEAIREAVPNADNIIPKLDPSAVNNMSEEEFTALTKKLSEMKAIPTGVQVNNAVETATQVTSEGEKESTSYNYYENLRKDYPSKIDINSPIWDQVDPELAKARRIIVDADTGLVGRDALLAADAASKVLRNNNYIPRVASGGDNHSKNHGSGRDANYSIDLAASVVDKNGKVRNIQLGKEMPAQIKNDMATAAFLASESAKGGHRVGYPDASSHHSMHIQQDPARPSAYWGYSEKAKQMGIGTSKRATLEATSEGRKFLSERKAVSRLTKEQKNEYFDKITGLKKEEKQLAKAEVESKEVTTEPQAPAPAQPEDEVKPLAQGDASVELNEPHMITPLDGTGQQYVAGEAGKESLAVTPEGKSTGLRNAGDYMPKNSPDMSALKLEQSGQMQQSVVSNTMGNAESYKPEMIKPIDWDSILSLNSSPSVKLAMASSKFGNLGFNRMSKNNPDSYSTFAKP